MAKTVLKRKPPARSPEAQEKELVEWFKKSHERGLDALHTQSYANFLIFGHPGTGKTFSLRTLPKPVLIHSFDPNGAVGLAPWIEKGEIIYDDRFEKEDPTSPSTFQLWLRVVNEMHRKNVFERLGAYVIDSLTMFSAALENAILAENNRAPDPRDLVLYHGKATGGRRTASVMEMRDYGVLLTSAMTAMGRVRRLPCHFVVLGHLVTKFDPNLEAYYDEPALSGQSKQRVPALFDEVYIAEKRKMRGQEEFVWHLSPQDRVVARSRWFGENLPASAIPQDFKAVLEAVGKSTEDKRILISQTDESDEQSEE